MPRPKGSKNLRDKFGEPLTPIVKEVSGVLPKEVVLPKAEDYPFSVVIKKPNMKIDWLSLSNQLSFLEYHKMRREHGFDD